MGSKLHRINDLVSYNLRYVNGLAQNVYCRILDIVDCNNISHTEYDIVTGCGEGNSKVSLIIQSIVYESDLSDLEECDQFTLSANPHNVCLVDIEYTVMRLEFTKRQIDSKIEFLKSHRNRIDKIDDLIQRN